VWPPDSAVAQVRTNECLHRMKFPGRSKTNFDESLQFLSNLKKTFYTRVDLQGSITLG